MDEKHGHTPQGRAIFRSERTLASKCRLKKRVHAMNSGCSEEDGAKRVTPADLLVIRRSDQDKKIRRMSRRLTHRKTCKKQETNVV